jgi:tRNA nucleotidyltransferase (CCA-adding enzyme)
VARRDRAILAAALGPWGGAEALVEEEPKRPSDAVRLAGAASPIELVLARALGAEWLDRYLSEWQVVALEIDGEDLIAAGVPQGPAVGLGLAAALCRKLDGEISGRGQELEVALLAARERGG